MKQEGAERKGRTSEKPEIRVVWQREITVVPLCAFWFVKYV
jgi:hypothetical protein